MSEAAAAFFANKKRKKKAFKFNANLIDAASVSQTTHVDAPALSKDVEAPAPAPASAAPAAAPASNNVVTDNEQEAPVNESMAGANEEDQQWDEAAATSRNKAAAASSAEVMDMKSLAAQGKGSDNISEKLRVEETKAQLAAAREGMERQAAMAKAEKERKDQEAREKEAARATAPGASGGGIWVSARMRAAQQSNQQKPGRLPGAGLDTANEELFPDLASADKISEQKKKSTGAVRVPKKTPVGGGASWAAKTNNAGKTPAKPPMKRPEDAPKKEEPKAAAPTPPAPPAPKKEAPKAAAPAPAKREETPAPAPAAAVPAVKPKSTGKKKKKKDLSTFKAGGS